MHYFIIGFCVGAGFTAILFAIFYHNYIFNLGKQVNVDVNTLVTYVQEHLAYSKGFMSSFDKKLDGSRADIAFLLNHLLNKSKE